jgi:mxaJ protein
MIDALATGDIDVALVWGPQAAYYAHRAAVPLELTAMHAPADLQMLPFEFSMSMGVRKDDVTLAQTLNDVLARRRADIDAILSEFGVPRANGRLATVTQQSP